MISDIIIIAVIITFIIIGAVRGLARTILNLAGLAINIMLTQWLSGLLSSWIYETFIQQGVLDSLQTQIVQNGFSDAAANSFDALPDWVSSLIASVFSPFGISLEDLQRGVFISDTQAQSIAQSIEQPLSNIIIAVLTFVLAILLFIIFLILIKVLIKFVLKFFEISVISKINHILGAVLGCVEGIAFVWVAINIFYVIMTYASPTFSENSTYFGQIFNMLCLYI